MSSRRPRKRFRFKMYRKRSAGKTRLYSQEDVERLRRIQDLTGLDVAHEDWLMIEIELKLLRLERATGDVQMLLTKPGARRAQFVPL